MKAADDDGAVDKKRGARGEKSKPKAGGKRGRPKKEDIDPAKIPADLRNLFPGDGSADAKKQKKKPGRKKKDKHKDKKHKNPEIKKQSKASTPSLPKPKEGARKVAVDLNFKGSVPVEEFGQGQAMTPTAFTGG